MAFFISLLRAFSQNCVPMSLSILSASLTVFGSLTPYLYVVLQYFALTLEIMQFRFLRVCGTHHVNAGSQLILLATVY